MVGQQEWMVGFMRLSVTVSCGAGGQQNSWNVKWKTPW